METFFRQKWISFVLVLGGLIAVALSTALPTGVTAQASTPLRLEFAGLQPLDAGHYEGWAIFGEEKLSTGKFAVASDGSLRTLANAPIDIFSPSTDVSGADLIVITIEADGDVDDVPSGIVVLAGALTGNSAALAFPTDLTPIAGGYILATPTDDDATNDLSGIWYLDPTGPSAALTLPALADGWVYEGWGVTQGTPLSMGRFSEATGADLAAPFSGPNAGPPFPGEDFVANLPASITPPVNLADGSSLVVLSVEPDLAGVDPTGAAPFSIKPLIGAVPDGLADHTLTPLDQNLGSLPSGTATVSTPPSVTALPSTGSGGLAGDGSGLAAWQIAAIAALATVLLGIIVRTARGRR